MAWAGRAAVLVAGLLTAAAACTNREVVDTVDESATATGSTVPACQVSDLLVPECGIWLGSSIPSSDGTWNPTIGLQEYEDAARNAPDIIHFYQRGSNPFPNNAHKAAAERRGEQRSILFFSWKVAPELTWRQIADGEADATIAAVSLSLVDYPYKMFLSVHHEPENDVDLTPGSGMTPADYVDMYRHVVTRLRDAGVDQVVLVMTYMGFERWASIVDGLYPGDDVVDWIGYDPYGFEQEQSFGMLLNRPNETGWPGFYDWATAKAPGKPIMVAEWGFQLERQPRAPAILGEAIATLREGFPAIKALVYWNGTVERVDGRLGQDTEVGRAFTEAYARLAADPYVNSTSPDQAP